MTVISHAGKEVMSRPKIALSIIVACVVGLAGYWGWASSPAAVSRSRSHTDADGHAQASGGTSRGSANASSAEGQRRVSDPIKDGDVATASRQALESAERGVETGDLDSLRRLRAALDARAKDRLLSGKDDDALDLAIACLSEDREAREDAQEFFQDEPATALHIQVKRVCLGQ
jgi:hypothetical protein